MSTSRVWSSPLISLIEICRRVVLASLIPPGCRCRRILRRRPVRTMRFSTTARQIVVRWGYLFTQGQGRRILRHIIRIHLASSGQFPCVSGRQTRLEAMRHREATISVSAGRALSPLNSRRSGERTYEGGVLLNPDVVEDNSAASHRCKPQTDVLPAAHVPPRLQSMGLFLRELGHFVPRRRCNMCRLSATRRVSHFGPWGQFALRAGMGARASHQFGPKLSRHHRMTRTGYGRFDMPSPNIRAAHPSRR